MGKPKGKDKENADKLSIKFSKYHGATNDLIMVNNTEGAFDKYRDNAPLISQMCSRRSGIGSDGLVELISHPDYAFEMIFYKATGERGRFGGNAARCATVFAHTVGLTKATKFLFNASDGQHWADYNKAAGIIEIGLGTIMGVSVYNYNQFFVDSGSPHHIVFVDDEGLGSPDLMEQGRIICANPQYEHIGGTNVNYVVPISENVLRIRTYERGVRGEIFACGTGSVASAIAYAVRLSRINRVVPESNTKPKQMEITVQCPAGDLIVKYRHVDGSSEFKNVTLTGPVVHVYSGAFKVPNYSQTLEDGPSQDRGGAQSELLTVEDQSIPSASDDSDDDAS